MTTSGREVGITWDWAEAGRGLLCALPGAVILLAVDVSLGMGFAIATLPVALLGVPPRRQRVRLGLVGAGFALSYGLGSVLGRWPVAAVAALTVLAVAAVLVSVRRPGAGLLPALLLPGVAVGMNHPAPGGLEIAVAMVVGCAWATLVTVCWPRHIRRASPLPRQPGRPTPSMPAWPRAATRSGSPPRQGSPGPWISARPDPCRLGGRGGDLHHAARSRPARQPGCRTDGGHLRRGRRGGLLLRGGPTEIVLAVVAVAAIAATVAVRTSRWYVVPAGTALVVLLISGVAFPSAVRAMMGRAVRDSNPEPLP